MARCIDADAFKQKLADKDIFFPALYENELDEMPTEDVVPKSEVEKFAEEIKLEFYREFDEIIPSIMADKIDELQKKYTEREGS